MLFGATAILATATAAALVWTFWPSGVATPTFAIIAADGSAASQQLAADVATRVGGLRDPAGADFHVRDAGPDPSDKGYALKVGAGSVAGRGQTLTLLSGKDNAILWSASLDLPQGNPNNIGQAVALTAQRALSCAADALSYRREAINQETLRLYLTGCSSFDAAYGSNASNESMSKLFERVIAKAPHFAPAWSKLFTVETEDLNNPFDENLPREVRSQLNRSKQLGIDIPETYALKASLLSPIDFLGFFRTLDEGIAKFPDSAFLFRLRGERYSYVGRMNDAVADTNQALQLDPLSPANHQEFANELAYSGDPAAGYAELRKAEQLWPNSLTVGMARFRMDLRFGDPREAQQLYLRYAAVTAQNPAMQKFIEARISPTPENIEAALEAERKINRQFPPFTSSLAQALAYFGRKDDVIDLMINYPEGKFHSWFGYNAEVMFRPYMRDVWRDPRSMAGAAHVGLLHYWKVSGKWPDFCFDPKLAYDCKKEAAKYPV
jgi:tetratricopeptide (TPR) repeat protein